MKLVAFVGYSDTGKTRLLERLVEELTGRGYTCAVVKCGSHSFDLSPEGKDTRRFLEAGAQGAAMLGPDGYAVMHAYAERPQVARFAGKWFGDKDFVLVEGGRQDSSTSKIEVVRTGIAERLPQPSAPLVAVISDEDMQSEAPIFRSRELKKIADFLESGGLEMETHLTLKVDGKEIALNDFVKKFFLNVITGMIASLDDVPDSPSAFVLEWENQALTLQVDGSPVRLNKFVRNIAGHVVTGLTMSLEGITEDTQKIEISFSG